MIIIWSHIPIEIDAKMFEYISLKYNLQVTNYYEINMSKERSACGYDENNEVFLREHVNDEAQAMEIIDKEEKSIHIFFGMLQLNKKLINYLRKKRRKFFVFSERYNAFGRSTTKVIKSIIRFAHFFILSRKFNPYLYGFLTYGKKGVTYYSGCGFNKERLFPMIYATNPHVENYPRIISVGPQVKFVYVGRMEFDLKGVDVLLDSLNSIIQNGIDDWHIDFIGGYGKNKVETIDWIKSNNKYASLIEYVPSDKIIEKLREYDVCIIPSRREGCNTLPAQCIAAGIACIVTDECVSDEVIQISNSGIIIHSNSKKELKSAIEMCIKDHNVLDAYKNNTVKMRNLLELTNIGDYFYDIIQYCMGNNPERPICPWDDIKN